MRELLVLRPGAVGDGLLAVPALRALRAALPDHRLTFAAQPGVALFLESVAEVDRGLAFDDPRLAWLFDPTLGPHDRVPDVVVGWLADPDGRVAGSLRRLGVVRTHIAPSRPDERRGWHCAEYLLRSVRSLAPAAPLDARPLRLPATPNRSILVHPGSGSPRKNWPPARFAVLVRALERSGAVVQLVVGEADAEAASGVDAALGAHLPRVQAPSLERLAERLAGCRAYVGNDSGVSHLAGIVGARTFALFGPTSADVWRPLGPRVTVVPFETQPELLAQSVLAEAGRAGAG